jgi:hypothetical protein
MSKTMGELISDVAPRLTGAPQGISIYQAANSVLSLVAKRLLDRRSDLLASGDLNLLIPAFGYFAALPDDFIAFASKPRAEDLFTDWMAGTVTSYNPTSGVLVLNATSFDGSDALASWNIVTAAVPGYPSQATGTSVTSLTPGTGTKTLTITAGLTLQAGTFLYLVPSALPFNLSRIGGKMQPEYLTEDENDSLWWSQYGNSNAASNRPSHYRIIGKTLYVRPKVTDNVSVRGAFFQMPADFVADSDVIPWEFFYEVFREGVVRIIMKGNAMPDADVEFVSFIKREIDVVLTVRGRALPSSRTKRKNFM